MVGIGLLATGWLWLLGVGGGLGGCWFVGWVLLNFCMNFSIGLGVGDWSLVVLLLVVFFNFGFCCNLSCCCCILFSNFSSLLLFVFPL